MTLYWDPPSNKVAGGANADGSGNFTTRVKPFPGDSPGVHHLCASVAPNPCANFALQGPPTPTPSASPSPADSPSPSPAATASPSDSPSPSPVAGTLSGLDVISKPPFVFLPILGGLGILGAAAYWWLSVARRPRPPTLPAASVVHRATRPDYRADFGTPPPAPAAPAPAPSAWADVLPAAPPPPSPGAAAVPPSEPVSPVEAEPASGDPPSAPDEPPELPEPGE
ncbi:hypothetical protein EPN29_07985 [bacterium]|nr:MAG: hypothetical protein EPN29_07985 [bacterium]